MTLNGEVAVVFPGVEAVSPALTAAANATQVGEHVTDRLG